MTFNNHDMIIPSPSGPIHARMSGVALDYLWADTGLPSETAAMVVAANREMIAMIALTKFEKAIFEEDGFVLINRTDVAH